jgi:hypothetical protein
MKNMSVLETYRLFLFQAKLIGFALWELKVLEREFAALGIDARSISDRTKAKQAVAMRVALVALGVDVDNERNPIFQVINAGIELAFPRAENRGSVRAQVRAAVEAFSESINAPADSLSVHAAHTIKTARGDFAGAERFEA